MLAVALWLDIAVALPAVHSPLGAACDAALTRAQREFASDIDFYVRQRTVVGEYEWSDMCGVWGTYRVTLAPDLRADHLWRGRGTPTSALWERRAHGWRARLDLRGDDLAHDDIARRFVDAFRAAVDVCLGASW